MNIINNEKLNELSGGMISKAALLAIATIGVFVVGVIDGYIRPLKCNR